MQYFSRFYIWYLSRLNATPAELAPFEAIKKQFGFIRKGMRGSLSGTHATMVPGVPYAIAAKFAHPGRPVIGFTGDPPRSTAGVAAG